MIQSYVYQKSIRALGLCHFQMLKEMNIAFDLIKGRP